jgi:hypothetical protein
MPIAPQASFTFAKYRKLSLIGEVVWAAGGCFVGWLANPARVAAPERKNECRYPWFAQFQQADKGSTTLTELA